MSGQSTASSLDSVTSAAAGSIVPADSTGVPTTLPPLPIPTDLGPVATEPVTPWELPPKGGYFDYQLSGDYPPASEVVVVTRDWFAGTPEPGLYNICYVNAFQTQPPDSDTRPDVREGWPAEVVSDLEDPDCAQKGFDAVEFDNLDSYTRFDDGPFGQAEALDYAATITAGAHAKNLAVAQKNTAELTKEQALEQVGFDFAVVEECAEYDECRGYEDLYGIRILSIEYTVEGMNAACLQFGAPVPVVRRDRDLVTPDDPGYQFETFCGGRGYG